MDYEEYMRSVLGYNQVPNNIYTNTYDDYYDVDYSINNNIGNSVNTVTMEMLEPMYPEIYRIVYPMVCKSCAQNSNREITSDLIDRMTEEIYINVEPEDRQETTTTRPILKNGDVRNPNAKEPETRGETRQIRNPFLRDLIRILILREFGRPNRPGPRPPRPPMPPRPPRPPFNQRPPWDRY